MSDTETKTKAPSIKTSIGPDWIVTIGDATYALADIPAAVQTALAARGLRDLLRAADDAKGAYASLVLGNAPASKGPKAPPDLDNWRKAIALAHIDEATKAGGIKAKTPEHAELTAGIMTKAHGITREALVTAKKHPAVVAHHQKLTGASASLAGLFAAAEPEVVPETA